jgi:hypothetical protein
MATLRRRWIRIMTGYGTSANSDPALNVPMTGSQKPKDAAAFFAQERPASDASAPPHLSTSTRKSSQWPLGPHTTDLPDPPSRSPTPAFQRRLGLRHR